jgi:hypothetical protein
MGAYKTIISPSSKLSNFPQRKTHEEVSSSQCMSGILNSVVFNSDIFILDSCVW